MSGSPGIQPTKISPAELQNETEVLNMVLPTGKYTFYFATDKTADSNPEPDWIDSVEVTVE